MSRFWSLLLLYLCAQIACQDVEIGDDEPVLPPKTQSENEPTVEEVDFYKGSTDISALLSFVAPPLGQPESTGAISLVAGKPATFIVSLENSPKSSTAYSLYILEAALHYPRYFGYHIQNFTVQRLQNTLEPKQQASLLYTFVPAVQLAAQQFDLAVILTYQDQSGNPYFHSLFNQTISFLEDTDGADVELLFLGIIICGIIVLALVFLWHWISSKTGRKSHKSASYSSITDVKENGYSSKKSNNQAISENSNGKVKQHKK
nr:Translocon associated protein subunit alpha [Hymenolepis microstoma]